MHCSFQPVPLLSNGRDKMQSPPGSKQKGESMAEVWWAYDGVLFSHREEENSIADEKMERTEGYNVERDKPGTERLTLHALSL